MVHIYSSDKNRQIVFVGDKTNWENVKYFISAEKEHFLPTAA